MPRRILASALVAALVTLTGCAASDAAATVNGSAVSTDDLEQTVRDFVAVGETTLLNGAADGDTVRGLLTSFIRARITDAVIAASGESVTDDDLAAVRDELDAQNVAGLPDTLRDLIVKLNAAQAVLARIPAPSSDEVAARYANNPKSLGMLCLRHLVVKEESQARSALVELGDAPSDEKFAQVAGKFSYEPGAAESGGALRGQTGECIAINEYQAGFDRDFVRGALAARTGVPTQPVKSSFGWHVIFVRPFEAVRESVTASLTSSAGEYLLLGALADADISVATRYGRWDPLAGSVVAP
ncbi:MAG: peptidylprolyl isomerase [Acidimicrobiia bacterium]